MIETFLPKEGEYDQLIVNAMNYSVLAGGKRLRPLMMQTAFHVFANDTKEPEILHRFMAAIECIHTYSLCHDDLPAMDNDMYRRGNLTTHAKYGEAFGILAGDGLLNYAFELIAEGMLQEEAAALAKDVHAFCVLAEKAGYRGMVG
ncbi:MAG: polyprenyl synthetase family protein, partial [Lachnospiraceae bacterium]|nr:polyprenyl synthetase family protein [Lachnospiraceae bacterium]